MNTHDNPARLHSPQGYKVHDTSTNGSYIIRGDQSVVRVPKGGALPLATGDVLRLSTVPNNNPSTVLECGSAGAEDHHDAPAACCCSNAGHHLLQSVYQ